MSKAICIAGESGTGKTTAMRNLNPNETYYIDCDKKGLSWKGWREQYNEENKNYCATDIAAASEDHPYGVDRILKAIDQRMLEIKYVVIDTLNGLMIGDEMRRIKEKNYDKWQDLAQCIYNIVDRAYTYRKDLTLIFVAHTQTERDDSGYMFTRIKTSGKKLDKICLESKFTSVLIAKCVGDRYRLRYRRIYAAGYCGRVRVQSR